MKTLATLTDAQVESGIVVARRGTNTTHSSYRNVPYAERYRGHTGILETPVQHLQQAARDEAQRRAS